MFIKFIFDYEWFEVYGDGMVMVGIIVYVQDVLGDVVFVDFFEVGKVYVEKEVVGVVEFVKVVVDVYMFVDGEIIEVNEVLCDDLFLVNFDLFKVGWFFKVKLSNFSQFDVLMDLIVYDVLFKIF